MKQKLITLLMLGGLSSSFLFANQNAIINNPIKDLSWNQDELPSREAELNAYWEEVIRVVEAGDSEGYGATFHEDGVLVSESSKVAYPMTTALSRWKQGLDDTRDGKTKVNLDFRFSQRLGDLTTAHEKGIFRHVLINEEGIKKVSLLYFEALLVKKDGEWKLLMEYQKSEATLAEWNALK